MDSSRTANLVSGFRSQDNSYCGKEGGPLEGAVRRASGSGGFPVWVTWQDVQTLPPTCALLCAPVCPRRWVLSCCPHSALTSCPFTLHVVLVWTVNTILTLIAFI